MRGKDPQIIRLEQAGVPTYDELVFVANADQQTTTGSSASWRRWSGASRTCSAIPTPA